MKITPELSEKISQVLKNYIENPRPEWVGVDETVNLRDIAANLEVLPVKFDWDGGYGLRPNGEIISYLYEESYINEFVTNKKIINMVLFRLAKEYPDLAELMPVRTPGSIICPGCGGTGVIKEFDGNELLSKTLNCFCGGVGWLPGTDEKYLYF